MHCEKRARTSASAARSRAELGKLAPAALLSACAVRAYLASLLCPAAAAWANAGAAWRAACMGALCLLLAPRSQVAAFASSSEVDSLELSLLVLPLLSE